MQLYLLFSHLNLYMEQGFQSISLFAFCLIFSKLYLYFTAKISLKLLETTIKFLSQDLYAHELGKRRNAVLGELEI